VQTSFINQSEVSRLLAAAVINQGFRCLLLSNPAAALAQGFHGERFHLEHSDRQRILAIRASTLVDFARQLTGNGDCSIVLTDPGDRDWESGQNIAVR